MKVMDVSLLLFGGQKPLASDAPRRVERQPADRARTDRRRWSGRARTRQAPVRVRHSRTVDYAVAAR